MKLNKHVMALNLAAVIAFGAVAGIVAPSIVSDDNVVAYAAGVTDGQGEVPEVTGGDVTFNENDNPAAKGCTFTSNGDGATVTLTAVDKTAKKVKLPGVLKVNGKEYKITAIKKGAFKGSKATSIDVSAIELKKLSSKQFDGAKKVKTIKVNVKKIKAKDINKNFVKGLKKLTTIKAVASKKQYKKIQKALTTAAKKTGNKATKVKRVSK